MDRKVLAQQLLAADGQQRHALLAQYSEALDGALAWEVKLLFDQFESSLPARAIEAANALQLVADRTGLQEITTLAAWVAGMAAQLEGKLDASLEQLIAAEVGFLALGQPRHAASTLVSKLITLAMLGRYPEALQTGFRARATFLAHHDWLAAGKIEQNLGNIYFRRDDYQKAEQLYRTARTRFLKVNDGKQLAQIENCLGSALTWQYRFTDAIHHYEEALQRAEQAGLAITQAEIESNLGGLMFFRGHYDQALDYLERSRRRYEGLGLAHNAAITEKELGEAYLDLNLIPEAATLFRRLIPTFDALGMKAELAWSLTHLARAAISGGQSEVAAAALARSHTLHEEEENPVGRAVAWLVAAQLDLKQNAYAAAIATSERAEAVFATVNAWQWLLTSRCLRAEATFQLGEIDAAFEQFTAILTQAEEYHLPQIVQRALTWLGMLALAMEELPLARQWLEQALDMVERMRATLPGEEFRVSFLSDKTLPYHGLVTIALADGDTLTALNYVERSRSQTLLELLGGALTTNVQPQDTIDAAILQRLRDAHNELNWLYHQRHRLPDDDERPSAETLNEIQRAAALREQQIGELILQLRHRCHRPPLPSIVQEEAPPAALHLFDLPALQQQLGDDSALVEYFACNDELFAFVVTNEQVVVVRRLCQEKHMESLVRRLRFQIDTLRHGHERLGKHLPTIIDRANHYLRECYDLLLLPLATAIGQRRLVIVPYRNLHYIPFHALLDGDRHVIEAREVSYAPSASVLLHCLRRPATTFTQAMLVGVPDAHIPHVRHEIETLAAIFPQAQSWLGAEATVDLVRTRSSATDVLHLACHGHFRPDNPLFSALQLSDGRLTVRDAYALKLNCGLVTLSACETGMNAIAPGDELVGLVRGFFAAGAPSLLVSLWPVDDATTVEFMRLFYQQVVAGTGLAAALRHTQCQLLQTKMHPFFWSPFILFGRYT